MMFTMPGDVDNWENCVTKETASILSYYDSCRAALSAGRRSVVVQKDISFYWKTKLDSPEYEGQQCRYVAVAVDRGCVVILK